MNQNPKLSRTSHTQQPKPKPLRAADAAAQRLLKRNRIDNLQDALKPDGEVSHLPSDLHSTRSTRPRTDRRVFVVRVLELR